eukprot:CAMPEP_0174271228 /NCGR_PEP_ID=MMETSP0439-20130205/47168_1 /TAXON_ID=0 /ORGANISM="Stereomyxa ramosa, Strain Chinc5" /LENGTH=149 /DNA_ID=CAMNT_0015361087 /DNA_START=92 /DNA_END=541 /DNA_ORIENTATION=-
MDRISQEHKFRVRCADGYHALVNNQGSSHLPAPYKASKLEGIFVLPAGDLFQEHKIVVWAQIQHCAFVLICEEDENRLLASNFIRKFAIIVMDHFKNTQLAMNPKEVSAKLDEILLLLDNFLPDGQLLFSSPHFTAHLQKEFDEMMAQK